MKRLIAIILFVASVWAMSAQTQIVAHRGYWREAQGAQNSLQAMHKADSIGAFACELDVWLTVDSVLVVNHDTMFQGLDMRTAPSDSILALTLANGENLPTLSDFLDAALAYPNLRLVLEQKPLPDMNREDLAAEMIVEMLRDKGLLERTDIISFSINACLAYRKICPQLQVYYLDGDLAPKKIQQLGLAGIDYHHSVLKAHLDWIDLCHDLGLKVNVWTIDKPEDISYFRSLGVDFITTNNPEEKD